MLQYLKFLFTRLISLVVAFLIAILVPGVYLVALKANGRMVEMVWGFISQYTPNTVNIVVSAINKVSDTAIAAARKAAQLGRFDPDLAESLLRFFSLSGALVVLEVGFILILLKAAISRRLRSS